MSNKLIIGSGIGFAFLIILTIGYFNSSPNFGCVTTIQFLYDKEDYENVDRTIREELRKHIADHDLVDSVYTGYDENRIDLSIIPKAILHIPGEYSDNSEEVSLIKEALEKNPKISNISKSSSICIPN